VWFVTGQLMTVTDQNGRGLQQLKFVRAYYIYLTQGAC